MRFTVVWKRDARDQLAQIWLASQNRTAITAAANEIDRWLRDDPELKGESRSGNERIVMVPPLAVVFAIHEADRIVRVLSVVAKLRDSL
jgi:hypothetical protein